MSSSLSVQSLHPAKPPIAAWRIVGGAFLHFAVPAYLVTVLVVTLFAAPGGASASVLAKLALGYSGWFLAGYGALALAGTLAAAATESALAHGRRRQSASDPSVAAAESRVRVTRALADAHTLPGAEVARLIVSIGASNWDHDDARFQELSRDLEQVVRAMSAAHASASSQSRADIADLATRSLLRIDMALRGLADDRSRLDQGDARTVARYVENRYGSSDFAGS
ncbi:MAG TPA: hypothetical protein VF409_07385 [Sphingomonas sp.]